MFIEIKNVLFQIKKNKKITPRLKDKLSSYGELMSIRIISGYLNKIGIESKFIDNIGIITDEGFGNAKILPETYSSSCLLYTSPSPRDGLLSRMPSSA